VTEPAELLAVLGGAAAEAVPAELLARLAGAVRAERATVLDRLGVRPVLWLAVAPLWTRTIAEAAGFPVPSVGEFVGQARAAGWCESRGSLLGEVTGELRFWMPDEARRDVIDLLTARESARWLLDEARNVARLVAEPTTIESAPEALRHWAELMLDAAPSAALVNCVEQAVENDNLADAQYLVAAGKALALVLAGTAELAADRARRLLSLGTRRRQDRRALDRYLDRPELSGAIARLLEHETPNWALHLRGAGGVGKTMLIRCLASGRYATDRAMAAIPVARADFDYLSPDYPVRRPVQLLIELADELALHTAGNAQADRALFRFRSTAASVHEWLSGRREERALPLQNPVVLNAIDDFAAAVSSLPRVLLILDTCEELAKADAGNPAAPAVRATFSIVERLHERAPAVRVLFAGRRSLPLRPYLAVRDVAGFTMDEARRYLLAFTGRPLSARLIDAMIRQSPAIDAGVPSAGDLPDRVSPFDLALYRSWAEEDPGLDAAQVEQGSDAYVEGRIIERLGDRLVRRSLPVLASVGRCRVATIAAFTGTDASALGPRLAEQEWIDADGDPPTHVAAKPALARRLQHYFSAPERAASFTTETMRLAEVLRREVRDSQLADIDVDELLTALRLSEPAAAVDLWDYIAEGVTATERWSWALNVTRRVLGESQDERWPTADALRATVLVSFIAASRRASALWDPRGAWAEVRDWSDRHPDPGTARVLRARAALGLLPYVPEDESLWTDLRAARPSAALAASATDAAHRMLEAGAGQAVARLIDEKHLIAALNGTAGPQVRAWARVAVARRATDEDPRGSFEALGEAEAEATVLAAGRGQEQPWPDLVLPDDLLARVRIERGLIAAPEAGVLESWESYAAANLGAIDGERLASLCLRLRLSETVVEPAAIERWDELDSYEPERVAICTAHDLVPPLCVMRAEAWLAAGYPERALALLDERRSQALRTRDDDATVRLADAETVRIARRMRLDDHRALLSRLAGLRDADPFRLDLRDGARRAMALVHREPPTDAPFDVAERPASWHAWWQSQIGNPTASWQPMWSPETTSTKLANDIELDLEEARQLRNPELEDTRQRLDDWLTRPRPARPPVRSGDPYRDVRAALRKEALTGAFYAPRPGVPARLLAEMAFEEAELLALRLPTAARPLFMRAARAYAATGDPLGELMANASLAAIRGSPGDEITQDLLRSTLFRNAAVGAALAGPPEVAGPWRFWAQVVQSPAGPGQASVSPKPVPTAEPTLSAAATPVAAPPSAPPSRRRASSRRTRVLLVAAGLLALTLTMTAVALSLLSTTHPSPGRPASESGSPTSVSSIIPASTIPASTIPASTIPASTIPASTIPASTIPASNSASATPAASASTIPASTIPASTIPASTIPASNSASASTIPASTIPASTIPASTIPASTIPASNSASASTIPASTIPASTVPASTVPASTVPASTIPASTIPATNSATPTSATNSSSQPLAFLVLGLALLIVVPAAAILGLVTRRRNMRHQSSPREGTIWPGSSRLSIGAEVGYDRRSNTGRVTLTLRDRPVSSDLWPVYRGTFPAAESADRLEVTWTANTSPASASWWHRADGDIPGTIQIADELFRTAQPWERILNDSLGSPEAELIAWTRYVRRGVEPFPANSSTAVILDAADEWRRYLTDVYRSASPQPTTAGNSAICVRHVIGRAGTTSAGPQIDVGGSAGLGDRKRESGWSIGLQGAVLLDTEYLTRGKPSLVILQAEPSENLTRSTHGMRDDQPEKLALAVDLMEAGAPAVIILPVLPGDCLEAIARVIDRHVNSRRAQDAQVLHRDLRKTLNSLGKDVLSDVVLFVNVKRYAP
jgi:hypothetical protein